MKIKIFSDIFFNDNAEELSVGRYNSGQLPELINSFKSLIIPDHLELILYEGENFQGKFEGPFRGVVQNWQKEGRLKKFKESQYKISSAVVALRDDSKFKVRRNYKSPEDNLWLQATYIENHLGKAFQFTTHGGHRFSFIHQGAGEYIIKCLDVDKILGIGDHKQGGVATEKGKVVVQIPEGTEITDEHIWRIEATGNKAFKIINKSTQHVLRFFTQDSDVARIGPWQNDAEQNKFQTFYIERFYCKDGTHEVWKNIEDYHLDIDKDQHCAIVPVEGNKAVSVKKPGKNAVSEPFSELEIAQRFQFEHLGGEWYKIENVYKDRWCLAVEGNLRHGETVVLEEEKFNGQNQFWKLVVQGKDKYAFIDMFATRALNAYHDSEDIKAIEWSKADASSTTHKFTIKDDLPPLLKLVVKDSITVCAGQTLVLKKDNILADGSDAGQLHFYTDKDLTQALATPNEAPAGTYYVQLVSGQQISKGEEITVTELPVREFSFESPIKLYDSKTANLEEVKITPELKAGEALSFYQDETLTTRVDDPTAVVPGIYYIQLRDVNGCTVHKPIEVNAMALPTLVVPLLVKGIYVPKKTSSIGITADFSYLPWNDGKRDYNPDYAPLGEHVETTPLQSTNGELQSGIHLHWTLPAALCGSVKDKDGNSEFPYVPVKWDVIPVEVQGGADHLLEKATVWSDYLHPEPTPLNLKYSQMPLPVPLNPENGRQPFRYMGIATKGEKPAPTNGKEEYYHRASFFNEPLTCLGYGSMSYASFYPDCREVFGHHVPLQAKDKDFTKLEKAKYMVRATLYRAEDGAGNSYPLNKLIKKLGISLEALFEQFNWPLTRGGVPKEIHLAGLVEIDTKNSQQLYQSVDRGTQNIQFSLGQSGTEALSAYLASELSENPSERRIVEEQLEAILMGDQINGHAADLSLKFLEKRHAQGFRELPGGDQWVLQARKPATLPNESFALQYLKEEEKQRTIQRLIKNKLKPLLALLQEDTIKEEFKALIDGLAENKADDIQEKLNEILSSKPAELTDAQIEFYATLEKLKRQINWLDYLDGVSDELIALNLQQSRYQQGINEIAGSKRELFGDWYKYMLAKYPPPESPEQFESADFPQPGEVAAWLQHQAKKIEARIKDTGKVKLESNKEGTFTQLKTEQEGAQAKELLDQFAKLKAVTPLPSGTDAKAAIVHQPAKPFYAPADPVLLIAGLDIPEPKLRQEPIEESNYSNQRFAEDASLSDIKALEQLMIKMGVPIAKNADWEPFILEWQAEFLPLIDRNDENSPQYRFTLRENQAETELLNPEGYQNTTVSTARGRTFLTPGAKLRKLEVLKNFLELNFSGMTDLFTNEHESIESKAKQYISSNQNASDTNDAILTAARAYLRLNDGNGKVLSQALGGFNDALLQLEHHLQPPLQDPLGTKEEKTFSIQLGELIGHESRLSPNPAKPFLPARAGSFRLIGLRLIDTWGRYRDLLKKRDFEAILSEPLYPIGAKASWAGLPLRVTQPLRLHANWLSAKKYKGQDISLAHIPYASPIVGWLCKNTLDNSLMYYDAQGDALGYFNRQGDHDTPPGKDDGFTYDNPALRRVVDHAAEDPKWYQSFMDATEDALARIAPKEHHLHQGIATLSGRPMAVVRLELRFELRGIPAQERTWEALREHINCLQHGEEDRAAHWQNMKFPVRLGNYMMLNDGLIGFWQEDEKGKHQGPLRTMAGYTDPTVGSILPHDREALLWLPLNGKPVKLTLLIDPRGSLHLTTGILPVQNLQLRKELLKPALHRIGAWFLQAPLLQPKGIEDVLRLQPPNEPGYEWSWMEAVNDHNNESTTDEWRTIEKFQAASNEAKFDQDSELREGWLILKHE